MKGKTKREEGNWGDGKDKAEAQSTLRAAENYCHE